MNGSSHLIRPLYPITTMPLSIYQTKLPHEIIQAEFHRGSNHLVLLQGNGELCCRTLNGDTKWQLELDCDPFAFSISGDDSQIAVLGNQTLLFYDLWSRQTQTISVDEKIRLLQSHKNCVVVGGFQKTLTMLKSSGKELAKLECESLIRQFRIVPRTGQVLIHRDDQTLQCCRFPAESEWLLEKMPITSELVASDDGRNCYFVRYPNELIWVDLQTEEYAVLDHDFFVRQIAISAAGTELLALDSSNRLTLYDRELAPVWHEQLKQQIHQIGLSADGDYFLTTDKDSVVNCFAVQESRRHVGEFIELQATRRIVEKDKLWSQSPGLPRKVHELNHLTVSPSGCHIAFIGLDGAVHVLNEAGRQVFKTRFPAEVENIVLSADMNYGYIYGVGQMLLIDFRQGSSRYHSFEIPLWTPPLVNFRKKRIYLLSTDDLLRLYDFSFNLLERKAAQKSYRRGIVAEALGIILFNDRQLCGISDTGTLSFNFNLSAAPTSLHSAGSFFYSVFEDGTVISLDVSNPGRIKSKFKKMKRPVKLVSVEPLIILEAQESVQHLKPDLSSAGSQPARFKDSFFVLKNRSMQEICRRRDGFFCYGDNQNLIWRFKTDDFIRESVLSHNGIAFTAGDSINYIELEPTGRPEEQFADFIEI